MWKPSKDEMETIITIDGYGHMTFYSDDPKHVKQWGKLVTPERTGNYPNGTPANVVDGVLNDVSISLRRKRQLTDAEKRSRVKRLNR